MKDFDTTLQDIQNTTIVLRPDRIPVRFQGNIFTDTKQVSATRSSNRTRRSTPTFEGRQNVVMNLMKVVDESLVEVREFLDSAQKIEDEANENTVVLLMKAVDKGLVKLRKSIVNDTDTETTEPAIGSLSNIINHGIEMVDLVLNQTTVYSVGEDLPENPVTTVLKAADQEVKGLKDHFFHNDTGNIDPPDKNQDSSYLTIMKLADQEILDIVKYFQFKQNSSRFVDETTRTIPTTASTTTSTTTESTTPRSVRPESSTVIKVIKLADEQLKDIVEYWATTTTASPYYVSETTTSTETPPRISDNLVEKESSFLKFMKRVDRELNQAQNFLYNVTDTMIGTKLSQGPIDKPIQQASNVNTNTRLSPIPIENNKNEAPGIVQGAVDSV